MLSDFENARLELKNKKMQQAHQVVDAILQQHLDHLSEIGLFGSLVKGDYTTLSDADLYLIFDGPIPPRNTKGLLRSLAEEHHCDLVFISKSDYNLSEPCLLVSNIKANHQIIWRRTTHDSK